MNDVILMRADLTRPGDVVRFTDPRYDYTIEEVHDKVGHIRHIANNDTMSAAYSPDEILCITRRA